MKTFWSIFICLLVLLAGRPARAELADGVKAVVNDTVITYSQVEELYYQNPSFGFYFLRISTARLFDNIARLEARLIQQQQQRAAQTP